MSDEPNNTRTKRRKWQAAIVVVLGVAIVVTLAVMMNLVQARL